MLQYLRIEFPYESVSEKYLVIGLHWPKLWSKVACIVFFRLEAACSMFVNASVQAAAFMRRRKAAVGRLRRRQSRRKSADRLSPCQCGGLRARRPSERRRRRVPWWASGRRTAGTWSRQRTCCRLTCTVDGPADSCSWPSSRRAESWSESCLCCQKTDPV